MAGSSVQASLLIQARTEGEAEIARLQQRIKELQTTAGSGAGFKEMAAAASSLRSQIDPMYAAQVRFNQALDTAAELQRLNVITEREAAQAKAVATQKLQEHVKALFAENAAGMQGVKGDGQRRASMIMLGQQIGDVGVQLQMGTSAARVFAMQAGQIGYALADMGGAAGKVGSFLAGPWGAALTIAISAVAMFAEELFTAEDGAKKLELVTGGLGDAQAALGDMFDLATGKIRQNTADVRLNTLAKIQNMRVTAAEQRAKGEAAIAKAGELSWGGFFRNFGVDLAIANAPLNQAMNLAQMREKPDKFIADLLKQARDPKKAEQFFRWSMDPNFVKSLNFKSTNITLEEFQQALINLGSGALGEQFAAEALSAFDKGNLPTNLRRPGRAKKPRKPSGPTPVQIEKTYENMLDDYTQAELKARRELSNSIEDRYLNQKDALESEIKAKVSDIAAAKGLSAQQKLTLLAAVEDYKKTKQRALDAQKADELAKQKYELEAIAQGAQLDILRAQEGMAKTAAERKALQQRILDAETRELRKKEQLIINSETATPEAIAQARARLEAINTTQGIKQQQLNFQNRTPIEEYADTLIDTATKFQNAWVNALKGTEDALVQFAMTGKLSFRQLANSIIADLIRIAIQQSIMAPLMTFMRGLSLFGGPAAAVGASAGAASTGPMWNSLVAANGAAFDLGGVRKFATGGIVSRPTMFAHGGGLGLMGEAGAEAIMPLRRLGNGRLGVEATGGSTNNVTVNVNVEGGDSKVSGDPGSATMLGNIIAKAVQAELVQQKRPGGLLAA